MRLSVLLFIRMAASYAVGLLMAAVLASSLGGSPILLMGYSLAVGAPFFLAAALIGLAFRRQVLRYPLAWSIAAPIVTGVIWFGSGLTMGEFFSGPALGLYAIFCAACCAGVFYGSLRRWPL